jgi:hypothetical protein
VQGEEDGRRQGEPDDEAIEPNESSGGQTRAPQDETGGDPGEDHEDLKQ